MIFASSIVLVMDKLKLKEDEDGNKIKEEVGIRSSCKVAKTRYAKPFQAVKVNIPYDKGMSPYSGLIDLFESTGVFTKDGNKLAYVDKETGEYLKFFRKGWTDELLHKVMVQVENQENDDSEVLSNRVDVASTESDAQDDYDNIE
jgi:hypothetical protein